MTRCTLKLILKTILILKIQKTSVLTKYSWQEKGKEKDIEIKPLVIIFESKD